MAEYEDLKDWIEHVESQGDGMALYQRAAKEAKSLLLDRETWEGTAAWMLKKLERLEALNLEYQPPLFKDSVTSFDSAHSPGADWVAEQTLRLQYRVDV